MSRKLAFALAFEGTLENARTSSAPSAELKSFPQFHLAEFLETTNCDLLSLTFPGTNYPIFRSRARMSQGLTANALATTLDSAGLACVSLDLSDDVNTDMVDLSDIAAVGISTTFIFDVATLRCLIDRVHRIVPDVPVVLGGAGTTLNPGWFQETTADFMVVGDAEEALPQLLDAINTDKDFDRVANLHWRDPDGIRQSNLSSNPDLDELPTPRYDIINDGVWPEDIVYETSRGCRFHCKFCSYPQQSPVWRMKSPERMAADFEYYASKGVKRVSCLDSTMLTPVARMRKFCQMLIERGVPLQWGGSGHCAQLQDPDFAKLLSAAGCRFIACGVESGDDQMLVNMNKHISHDRALLAIKNIKDAGMICIASLLIGFPGETAESAEKTLEFIFESKPHFYTLQSFQIRDLRIPVLAEARRYSLELEIGEEGQILSWTHATMTSDTADRLVAEYHNCIAHELPETLMLSLLRLTGVDFLVPDPAAATFFMNRVQPVLKEWQRALASSPEISFGGKSGSLETYDAHRQRAIHLYRRLCGTLRDGSVS